jgi:hypothetical protein
VRFIAFVAAMLVFSHYARQWAGDAGMLLWPHLRRSRCRCRNRIGKPAVQHQRFNHHAARNGGHVDRHRDPRKQRGEVGIAFRLGSAALGWSAATILVASGTISIAAALAPLLMGS